MMALAAREKTNCSQHQYQQLRRLLVATGKPADPAVSDLDFCLFVVVAMIVIAMIHGILAV